MNSVASTNYFSSWYTSYFFAKNYDNFYSSTSFQLKIAQNLFIFGNLVSLLSQHTYSLNPFPFLSLDILTSLAIFVHHQYIGSILLLGSLAHLAIFIVRDFSFSSTPRAKYSFLARLLIHKNSILAHLSWLSLFLGFHTLLVFVHNDSVVAFSESDKQILLDPIYSQILLDSQADSSSPIQPRLPILSGDLMAHHSISLGIHLVVLIMAKGLDAGGSKNIFADKAAFGFSYPCDGPGRGGT
jgi:photosystem I P700 chlorophyll a apoprotein A2